MKVDQSHKLLGEILVEGGYISQEQLDEALDRQAKSQGGFLGQILVELGHLDQHTLSTVLVKYCKIPYLSLLDYLVDENLLDLIPKKVCIEHKILPIDKLGKNLTVAVVDPLNKEALKIVREICSDLNIKPVLCDPDHFNTVIKRLFNTEEDGDTQKEMTFADFGLAAPMSTPPPEPEPEETETQPEPEIPEAQLESVTTSSVNMPPTDTNEALELVESTMRETYNLLARRVTLFKGIDPEFIAAIFNSGMTKEFEEGTVIFSKDDMSSELYVIMGGEVTIQNGDQTVAVLSAGEMFGEMALLSGAPRSASVVATKTTCVFFLDQTIFNKLMTKSVAIRILLNMLRISSERLLTANKKLSELEK